MIESENGAPIWLACKSCGHQWDQLQPTHVPVETWVAHVEAYHCPQCGADYHQVLLRTTPLDQPA